jgi:hypothetical protein
MSQTRARIKPDEPCSAGFLKHENEKQGYRKNGE